jgi:hypothetical protein
MTMRTWTATRDKEGVVLVETVDGTKRTIQLAQSLKVYNHSPSGFEFGYGGSGPAQLALAILMRYFGDNDKMASKLHQNFKLAFVATAQGESFAITDTEIDRWRTNEGAG